MDRDLALRTALEHLVTRPELYSASTADALWTSPDISEMMLRFHLDGEVDVASRRTETIETSVGWLDERFGLGPGKRVLDLGCGPGLYTNRLARTGASVIGVDFSERSLEYARDTATEAGIEVEYVHANYVEWSPDEPVDLAMMIMCDYCALLPDQRDRILARLPDLLAPGGSFLFDVYSLALYETWEESFALAPDLMDGFWSATPYIGVLGTFRYDEAAVAVERYTIVEERGAVREYFNWFRHYDPASLTAEVETAGLRVEEVLGDVAGAEYDPSAPEFAVVVSR